jgi:predicted phosphate transport protein (TIGR00153 family)
VFFHRHRFGHASKYYFGSFCQVPIKPLQKHIVKVHVCCEQLIPFFDAVAEDRWEDAEKIRQQIAQLEKEADILKREIRLKLPAACSCRSPVPICWSS